MGAGHQPEGAGEDREPGRRHPPVIAIFGPTGIGKTGVAIQLAGMLRERGEDAVAVNCDSMQVYRGLELISGAASPEERRLLEHRLLSFVSVSEEYSAGRFGTDARKEIDGLVEAGKPAILVGGTGLYLRAALSSLPMLPRVEPGIRREVEGEASARGGAALHRELPAHLAERVHPNDLKRITRLTELIRSGIEPHPDHRGGGELWTREMRHPTILAGLVEDDDALRRKIHRRVEAMAAAGAADEAEDAIRAGASRTARSAIGFEEFRRGDLETVAKLHRRYGRRQMTWMRRMEGVRITNRNGLSDREVASRILDEADDTGRSGRSVPSP